MGKRKEERQRIAVLIQLHIDALKAGDQLGHWDVPHKPTATERRGRVKLLEAILREIGGEEK